MDRLRVCVFCLGCKVNQNESESIVGALIKSGFDAFCEPKKADLYIINTCAVTGEAEKKSRQAVARVLKYNENAGVIICGCASQNSYAQFSDYPNVLAIIGVAGKSLLAQLAVRLYEGGAFEQSDLSQRKKLADSIFSDIYRTDSNLHAVGGDKAENACVLELPLEFEDYATDEAEVMKTRASVKICDGCNNFCSYCLVPYVRGRSRSKPIERVVEEVLKCAQYRREVVLIGIDISSYGLDIGTSLLELVKAIKLALSKNNAQIRVRLGSIETSLISDELLIEMQSEYFCPHFHLSLQSGSDGVLKRMNRHYTADEFYRLTQRIKNYFPDSFIATDIIVGFPEESDEEFDQTLRFAEKVGFSDIHIFKYSRRKGTRAYSMEQVDGNVKLERIEKLNEVKRQAKESFIEKSIGQTARVIFEERKGSYMFGHTDNYIGVYLNCESLRNNEISLENKFVNVKLTGKKLDGLEAKL
ncbi:MAG: tRNA (N(6)-L-threonylcarbamoyladenosine(37)-C(2))-methylthiotransferase MtaB [Clostridia bacterium]|nr:tRNA (N(6)-L-threonylcarbamoyladenosine(37)-C(2))-methylthiotransferase MtaB [Clostridia bacterium]